MVHAFLTVTIVQCPDLAIRKIRSTAQGLKVGQEVMDWHAST